MRKEKAGKRSEIRSGAHRAATPDPLRAYEQFGRVDILEGGLAGPSFVNVNALANLAQQQLDSGHADNAANLLRAAEHLSFAALAPKDSARLTAHIPSSLLAAVAAELERLTQGAEELWAESGKTNRAVIEKVYLTALADARQAFVDGAYRPALQLAHAAEALAHVGDGLPSTIPGERQLTRRIAS